VGWLAETREVFFHDLRWLYATRNLTIHRGQSALPGDVQLAISASGLADLTLEFLGAWYGAAAEHLPSASAAAPAQIVATLDQRCRDIEDHLRKRHSSARLLAEHLTSPTSNGWDR
jgi:hypothetical protein